MDNLEFLVDYLVTRLEKVSRDTKDEDKVAFVRNLVDKYMKEACLKNIRIWDDYYSKVEIISWDEAVNLYFKKLSGFISDEELCKLKKFSLIKIFRRDIEINVWDILIFFCFKETIIQRKFESEYNHEESAGTEIYDKYQVIREICNILGLKNSFDTDNIFSSEDVDKHQKRLSKLCCKGRQLFEIKNTFKNLSENIKELLATWSGAFYEEKTQWRWLKGKKKHYTIYSCKKTPCPYEKLKDKLLKLTPDVLFDIIPLYDEFEEAEEPGFLTMGLKMN